ncbi:MAG: HGxxPAAW family protein [Actinomycetes bacterium]
MDHSHGHTPAAWTAVVVMLSGFLVMGVALPLAMPWLFFVGAGVVVVGAVAGKVMQMMGLGNTVAYKDERDPDYDDESTAGDRDEAPTERTEQSGKA